MEHWDAWLAEDVFREVEAVQEEGERGIGSAGSSSTIKERKKPKKKVKKGKAGVRRKKEDMDETEKLEMNRKSALDLMAANSSGSPTCPPTPTRGSSRLAIAAVYGGEKPGGRRPTFVRQMLDEAIPLEEKLKLDMPEELKDELRNWERKFPDLTVRGRAVEKCPQLQELERLRLLVARRIVEDHLWPEMRSVLLGSAARGEGKKGGKKKEKPTGMNMNLLMPELDGNGKMKKGSPKMANKKKRVVGTKQEERVKLPAIKKK